ncbi:hypothetical protein L9F63_016538, partial [Diploptera punctata]
SMHIGEIICKFSLKQTGIHIRCLFSGSLCSDRSEWCYDDYAFGRCLQVYSDPGSDETYRYDLNRRALHALEREMQRLFALGYRWSHTYTQCVLQGLLHAIRYDLHKNSKSSFKSSLLLREDSISSIFYKITFMKSNNGRIWKTISRECTGITHKQKFNVFNSILQELITSFNDTAMRRPNVVFVYRSMSKAFIDTLTSKIILPILLGLVYTIQFIDTFLETMNDEISSEFPEI